nr:MAG TPA: hypothetical protein [Caudoviricetes sp.]
MRIFSLNKLPKTLEVLYLRRQGCMYTKNAGDIQLV